MTQEEFKSRYSFDKNDKLGENAFGEVYKAYDNYLDRKVVIKITAVRNLCKEVEMAKALPVHPNIVRYEEDCNTIEDTDIEQNYAILPYYEEGNLLQLLEKESLSIEQKESVLSQIIEGVEFLHDCGIIHRNLRPQNILMIRRENGEYVPKISDFSISKKWSINYISAIGKSFSPSEYSPYSSPEQLDNHKTYKNTDLWSFGVIAFQTFTGQLPFTTGEFTSASEAGRLELLRQITVGNLPDCIEQIPDPWQTLIRRCLIINIDKRIKNISEAKIVLADFDRDIVGEGVTETGDILEINEIGKLLSEIIQAPAEIEQALPEINQPPIESEQTLPEINQTPIESEQTLVEINQTPIESEQAVTGINEPTVEIEQALAEINHPPIEIEQVIIGINEPAAENEQALAEINHPPIEIEQVIIGINEPVAEIEQTSGEAEQILPETEHALVETEQTFGVTEQTPKETEQTSVEATPALIEPEQVPAEIEQQASVEPEQITAETEEAPVETGQSSSEAEQSSLEPSDASTFSILEDEPSSQSDSPKKNIYFAIAAAAAVLLLIFGWWLIVRNESPKPIDIPMVFVQGGTFMMGCSDDESADCFEDEKPVWKVTVSSFYISKYEVTQAEWKEIMGSNPSHFKGDDLPVENVSWNDVREFIRKLNLKTGKQYRFPTEAEWEYAARGGNRSRNNKYSGSNTADSAAWYINNSKDETHAVGTKLPNELGINDMSGNVWEWCDDCYSLYNGTTPTDSKASAERVLRGGSWNSEAGVLRVSNRASRSPEFLGDNLGFRLACSFNGHENLSQADTLRDIPKKQAKDTVAQKPVDSKETQVKPQNKNYTETAESLNMEMIHVQGGTFSMGCTPDQGSDCPEKTIQRVTLGNFYIGKYEVTQAQWKSIIGSNPSHFKGDRLPVEQVSWSNVQEFIRKLNAKTGKHYRLPTEAEWEYAARGGNKSKGHKFSGSNTIDNTGSGTYPVGTKSPNEIGIYDMSGNVWEWCNDWYGSYSRTAVTNPQGPSSGSQRVLRGGSWMNRSTKLMLVSTRNAEKPEARYSYLGFRLACSE